MIHRVFSDLPTFKNLTFHGGLNILLADRSPDASTRNTRNRAGKTSLIEVVHFLMGARAEPSSVFRTETLRQFKFGMEVDLGRDRLVVERVGDEFGNTILRSRGADDDPAVRAVSNADWCRFLGERMFGILGDDTDAMGPSFRSLISYFVRRQGAGGFSSPFRAHNLQSTGDMQVALSFLLGTDWTIAARWQAVRDRERELKDVNRAVREGVLGPVPAAAEARSAVALAEERVARLRRSVADFRIHEQYHDLEKEAAGLSERLASLADENTADMAALSDLEKALAEEVEPTVSDLERLYSEAGVVLPAAISKRFEEVRAFHTSVTANRKTYLAAEMAATKERLNKRSGEASGLDARRSKVMNILKTHGALDQFLLLQEELARASAELERIRHQQAMLERLERGRAEIRVEKAQLQLRLQQDHHEQREALHLAIATFRSISSDLYEDAGTLVISEAETGPQYKINIQGSRSKGITNMQIFCFDMMLTVLWGARGAGPGFLVHDSHLFDGVDERQVAHALEVGAALAKKHGFQYIVTMNSDALPRTFSSGFSVESHLLPVVLTDAREDGGLFGIRFE